jgi:hypothetical protein
LGIYVTEMKGLAFIDVETIQRRLIDWTLFRDVHCTVLMNSGVGSKG